jgi:uncharacterized integral membrane protein
MSVCAWVDRQKRRQDIMKQSLNRLSGAGWLTIIVLLALLVASAVYAVHIWNSVSTAMSGWGWSMLLLGVVITTALGVGLMFLVFYSARHDMDR